MGFRREFKDGYLEGIDFLDYKDKEEKTIYGRAYKRDLENRSKEDYSPRGGLAGVIVGGLTGGFIFGTLPVALKAGQYISNRRKKRRELAEIDMYNFS